MKKTNFSLEKFASKNVKTLDANELNLIVGSAGPVALCSNNNDTDGKSDNCSQSYDKDDAKYGGFIE